MPKPPSAKSSQPEQGHNPFLEREVIDALRRVDFAALEKIPEMRDLMLHMQTRAIERSRLADSLGVLPVADLRSLFADYVEEAFDTYLHGFFDKLYRGCMDILRVTISARMELLEESMNDMKRSVLMSQLHPHAWIEAELATAVTEYVASQPGQRSPLLGIYTHLSDRSYAMPGVSLLEKYEYLIRILRRMPNIRELTPWVFEVVMHGVKEESETHATSADYTGTVLPASIRKMATKKAAVPD